MRITLIVAFLALCSWSMNSQATSGTITYSNTLHLEVPEGLPPGIDFPTKRETDHILTFQNGESVYQGDKSVKKAKTKKNKRGRRMWGRSKAPIHYYSVEDDKHIESVELFKKDFVVTDTIQDLKWKVIATEQRDILGYAAMKSMLVDTSKAVEAWFTPQIPVSVGPGNYYGLPGAILALTIDESVVILAKEVNITDPVQLPETTRKGKKMTREKFEAMREEKIEEMKKMWGGNKRRWRND